MSATSSTTTSHVVDDVAEVVDDVLASDGPARGTALSRRFCPA